MIQAWCVNTKHEAHTTFSGYEFNSIIEVDGILYGSNATSGLFRLSGDTDNGQDISCSVKWHSLQLNDCLQSYVPDAYINAALNEDSVFTAYTDFDDDGIEYPVPYRNCDYRSPLGYYDVSDIKGNRVKLARGVHGNAWSFKLSGTGKPFSLKDIIPSILKSRRS